MEKGPIVIVEGERLKVAPGTTLGALKSVYGDGVYLVHENDPNQAFFMKSDVLQQDTVYVLRMYRPQLDSGRVQQRFLSAPSTGSPPEDQSGAPASSKSISFKQGRGTTRLSTTTDSWTRSSSPASQEEPGRQAKVEDNFLEILHIDKPTLAADDTLDFRIEVQDPLLKSWIIPVFLHEHFRLSTAFLAKYPHLKSLSVQDSQHDAKPMLSFDDGEYGLEGLPDSFSFNLSDPDFHLCANIAIRLAMNSAKRLHKRSTKHGEGTYEMELYSWLYACFSSGCSDYLDRAWRGTLADNNFPFKDEEDLMSLKKADLIKLVRQLRDSENIKDSVRYGFKRWQPDGIVGYTKKALEKQLDGGCLAETVYLGLVAIEHKKQCQDVEDLNMLAYEMHLICRRQQQLGIKHPLAFGIYWAGVRFMLYCMEVHNDRYVPIQLLQYSCEQDAHILLVFRALWYLRLHGIHMALLAQQEDQLSFQEKANVYPIGSAPVSTREGEGTTGDTDKRKDKRMEEDDDNDNGNGRGRRAAPARVAKRTNKQKSQGEPVLGETVHKLGWQASEMELVTSCYNSDQYWVSSEIVHQGSHTLITLGKSRSTDQLVVLKRRLDGNSKRLKREAEALDLLHGCEGVVQLLDMAYGPSSSHRSWLVLEHVKGRPFLMQAHNCSRARLRFYFHKLIKTLDICHQNDVVHHDIKPGNVLITDDDQVVLIDFDHAVFPSMQTRDVEGCTAGFTPPELGSGSYCRATGATDAWGVGIMLLQSLLWTYPITDEAAWSLVEQLHLAPEGNATNHLVDWIESTSWDDYRFGHPDNTGPYAPAPWCSEEGLDLARRLLDPDPCTRLDLADALNHPFLWPPYF